MKKLTLAIAGLLLAGATFAAPCGGGKDKGSASCCKGKKEACAKKSGKSDCGSKKETSTAKK